MLFSNVDFTMNRGEKISLVGKDSAAINAFFDVLSGKTEADSGTIEFGQTITHDYLPNENTEFFTDGNDLGLIDWLRQFSEEKDEDSLYYFAGIDGARFKKPVVPGDQLILNALVERYKSGIWKFKAFATVNEEIVCEAELLCALRKKAE